MTTKTDRLEVVGPTADAASDDAATQPLLRVPDLEAPTERYDKKRRGQRVMVHLPATVTASSGRATFVIDNLSSSGARLTGPLALKLGQRIAISFVLEATTFDVTAEIVRVHTPDLVTDQIAVQFIEPPAATVLRIEAFVAAMLR